MLNQQTAEAYQKTTKTIIRDITDMTNQRRPALDYIRICAAILLFLVESDNKHYPDSPERLEYPPLAPLLAQWVLMIYDYLSSTIVVLCTPCGV